MPSEAVERLRPPRSRRSRVPSLDRRDRLRTSGTGRRNFERPGMFGGRGMDRAREEDIPDEHEAPGGVCASIAEKTPPDHARAGKALMVATGVETFAQMCSCKAP